MWGSEYDDLAHITVYSCLRMLSHLDLPEFT